MGGGLPVEIVQNGREKGNLEKGWRDLTYTCEERLIEIKIS